MKLSFYFFVISVLVLVEHQAGGVGSEVQYHCRAFNKCDSGHYCVGGYCRKPLGLKCAETSHCKEYPGGKCEGANSDKFGDCSYYCSSNGKKCKDFEAGCCDKNCDKRNGLCGGCVNVGSTCTNDNECCGNDRKDELQVLCFKDHCKQLLQICKLRLDKPCKKSSDCYLSGNSRTECQRVLYCSVTSKCSTLLEAS